MCNKCEATLPLDQFYRNSSSSDGRRGTCKKCQPKQWITPEANRKACLAYYYKNRETRNAKRVEWDKANPEKLKAHRKKIEADPKRQAYRRSYLGNYPRGYVARMISSSSGVDASLIPNELIEAKTAHLILRKSLKEIKNGK